jgi:hypothetical protein
MLFSHPQNNFQLADMLPQSQSLDISRMICVKVGFIGFLINFLISKHLMRQMKLNRKYESELSTIDHELYYSSPTNDFRAFAIVFRLSTVFTCLWFNSSPYRICARLVFSQFNQSNVGMI